MLSNKGFRRLLLGFAFCFISPVVFGQIIVTKDSVCFKGKTELSVSIFGNNDSIHWQYESLNGWLNAINLFSRINKSLDTCEIENVGKYDSLKLRVIIDSSNLNQKIDTFYTNLFFHDSIPNISISNFDTSVCYNSKSNTLFSNRYSKLFYDYRWYTKGRIAKSWILVQDSNSYSLSPGRLTRDTFFRVVLHSIANCGNKVSNEYFAEVADSLQSPKINGDTTVCYNTKFTLKLTDSLRGGLGAQNWVWQISSGSGWNIIKSNSINFDSSTTSKLYYRITAQNVCGERYSNQVEVDVFGELFAAKITGDDTVCFGSNSRQIKWHESPAGGGMRSYKWEIKWKGEDWSDTLLNNLSDSTLDLFNLKNSLSIRQKTFSTKGCGEIYSNKVDILTLDDAIKPVISKDSTICNKTVAKVFVVKESQGAGGRFLYEWQVKAKNSWNSTNDTTLSLTVAPNNSSYYRVQAISIFGCESVFSDSTYIGVLPEIETPQISRDTIVCFRSQYDLNVETPVSGGSGNFEKKWSWSIDSSVFYDELSLSDAYRINNIRSKYFVQYSAIDKYGCGRVISNLSVISIFDSIEVSHILGDTLVCYGADIELKLNSESNGGSNRKRKYWTVSTNESFEDLQVFNTLNVLPLTELKNDFYVKFCIQDSVCGLSFTPIFEIDVLDSIVPDKIGADTSICYGSSFDREIIGAITEDGISERVLEYSNSGQDWFKFNSLGTQDEISIAALFKNKYYRTQIITEKGCKSYSNNIGVIVFDSLSAAVIAPLDTICYGSINTVVDLEIKPSGANNQYTTFWEFFDGAGWSILSSNTEQFILNKQLKENIEIRHKTISNIGCGTIISDVTDIFVYDSFVAPTIASSQILCYGENYEPVVLDKLPVGGKGNYSYTFHLLLNGNDSVLGDLKGGYNGVADNQRSVYISVNDYCGEVKSNIVNLNVNPLPDTVMIKGPTEVCKGTLNCIYSLDSVKGISYEWLTTNTSTVKHNSELRVLLDWNISKESDTIKLRQVFSETGCANIMTLPIRIDTLNSSPELTEIIRKTNSNILIAKDSTPGLIYHWGYINKEFGNIVISPVVNPTQRYYNYLEGIDTQKNIYFVKTFLNGCPTTSFYKFDFKSNFLETQYPENNEGLVIYPNPCTDFLNVNQDDGQYFIYSLEGVIKANGFIYAEKTKIDLRDLKSGVYLMVFKSSKGEIIVSKFIKQR